MVLPVPVNFLFTNRYTVYFLSKDSFFHYSSRIFTSKHAAIPPAIIEIIGDGPFSKKYTMIRTCNICVDWQ